MQAQTSGQAAKDRAEAYRTALQELTLFRSRTSAALLQVSHAVRDLWPRVDSVWTVTAVVCSC